MIAKYLIYVRERPIALKHNMRTRRCIVGGHPESILEMQSIVSDYFDRKQQPRPRFPARNKVRLEFDLSLKKFTDGVQKMMEHGIRVQPCKSHVRLMR